MITVLVNYKQWVDSGNAHFDDTLEDRSKVVEVVKLTDLNDLFRCITKIDVVNKLTIPVVSVPKGTLCDLDGKRVMVKFKVTKHLPKIIIEDI